MKLLLVAALFLLSTATAQAKEAIKTELELPPVIPMKLSLDDIQLPKYKPCTFEGERYACYNLLQQKELLSIETQANTWVLQLTAFAAMHEAEGRQLTLMEEQLRLITENDQAGRKRVAELTKQMLTEIEQKNDWRAKAETPVIWPYLIGGVAVAIAGGLAVGVYVSR